MTDDIRRGHDERENDQAYLSVLAVADITKNRLSAFLYASFIAQVASVQNLGM